jgi:hypothetical protein
MAIRDSTHGCRGRDVHGGSESVASSAIALLGVDDAGDEIPLDELPLAACRLAEGGGGEAIEIAHRGEDHNRATGGCANVVLFHGPWIATQG